MKHYILLLNALLYLMLSCAHAGNLLSQLNTLESSSLVLTDSKYRPILSKQAQQAFVPASTVKVITALLALNQWGRSHRFNTEFYLHKKSNILLIKGLGDPFLISEELDLIVAKLIEMGVTKLSGIVADNSYFSPSINAYEAKKSNNPYDAFASALAVNFNTLEVNVQAGEVTSAEIQTPITDMARKIASQLPDGRHRIHLGAAHRSTEYFKQVFSAKLRAAGVNINQHELVNNLVSEDIIQSALLLYTHKNSHSLEYIVKAMLNYSNNFIANQLFLLLGIEKWGAPGNMNKSQRMLADYIDEHFQWQHYVIQEGAGLSKANRLSALQLIEVLNLFAPYRDLMPQQQPNILAKTGTLNGVSCYAGYLFRKNEWQAFALMINQPVRYRFREQLAEQLLVHDG